MQKDRLTNVGIECYTCRASWEMQSCLEHAGTFGAKLTLTLFFTPHISVTQIGLKHSLKNVNKSVYILNDGFVHKQLLKQPHLFLKNKGRRG